MTSNDVMCSIQDLTYSPDQVPEVDDAPAEAASEPLTQRPLSELEEQKTTEREMADDRQNCSGLTVKPPLFPVSDVPEGSVLVTKDHIACEIKVYQNRPDTYLVWLAHLSAVIFHIHIV